MSSKADRPGENIWVVVSASSRMRVGAGKTPGFLRPLMGRTALDYVLDAVGALKPAGVIAAIGPDPDSARRSAGFDRGVMRVVEEEEGAAGIISELRKALAGARAGRRADLLFVSAALGLITADLLRDFVIRYRDGQTPCRARVGGIVDGAKGEIGLFISDGSVIDDIGNADDVSDDAKGRPIFSLLEAAAERKGVVADFVPQDPNQLVDVSSSKGYAAALRAIRQSIVERLMHDGVIVIDPERTYVDWDVRVGEDTVLYPDTYLEGKSAIGNDCAIGPNVKIVDSTLADGVVVKMCSVITESDLDHDAQVGPFAHIRPKTRLGQGVKIGNFVEVKKSVIERGSKANHLSYIGDAVIGKEVNVGAGTITCNYDGVNKHVTQIGDGVFIGSDTQFVAPVSVGDHALIGAGSTITKDVPPNTLAVSRAKQVNLPGRGVKPKKK